MRISDWSSDVCSSDLDNFHRCPRSTKWRRGSHGALGKNPHDCRLRCAPECYLRAFARLRRHERRKPPQRGAVPGLIGSGRSEEHTSELQSLMRISYAVFCLKKKTTHHKYKTTHISY